MLDEVLLAALLIGWAAVLLPSALRSRRSADPIVTVGGFTEAMAVLRGRPQGREIMVPSEADRIVAYGERSVAGAPREPSVSRTSARARLRQRRKAMFVRLLLSTVLTFALAMPIGGYLWPVFFTSALALFGYVAMLRHHKVERDAARTVIRAMHRPPEHGPDRGWQPVGEAWAAEYAREPVAVGAEAYGGVAVATSPDTPWEPQASVRIRRWET